MLSGVNIQTQAALVLPVTGEPVATHLRVAYDGERFTPAVEALRRRPAVIEIENTGTVRGSLLLINWRPKSWLRRSSRRLNSTLTFPVARC